MEYEQNPLASLLSDPNLGEKVNRILDSLKSGDASREGGIPSVLNSPEMMAKLPSLLASFKPTEEKKSPTVPEKNSPDAQREQLLCALKPFLSKERQSVLDSILQISKLGGLLRQLT